MKALIKSWIDPSTSLLYQQIKDTYPYNEFCFKQFTNLHFSLFCFLISSSGYLKAKQYMEEENYDKIISECTKEIESGGRYTAEALLLRATFYLLIGNATAAQPDLDRVINMQDANVKVLIVYSPKDLDDPIDSKTVRD